MSGITGSSKRSTTAPGGAASVAPSAGSEATSVAWAHVARPGAAHSRAVTKRSSSDVTAR
jgi:hypothetical protein